MPLSAFTAAHESLSAKSRDGCGVWPTLFVLYKLLQ